MSIDKRNIGNVVLALILIGMGILFLIGQFLRINFWAVSWPFFIIVPGLLFFVGMVLGGKNLGALAIPGSIITTVGLILLYQNLFHQWQSWAYAWALIFPTSVGLGLVIQGVWDGNPRALRDGRNMLKVGLIMFAIAGVFFELVIGIGGFPFGRYVWPVLLILLGVYLLLQRSGLVAGRKNPEQPRLPEE